MGEAFVAIIILTYPRRENINVVSSEFSKEMTLTSASAVTHCVFTGVS